MASSPTGWLTRHPATLAEEEELHRKAVLDRCPELTIAAELTSSRNFVPDSTSSRNPIDSVLPLGPTKPEKWGRSVGARQQLSLSLTAYSVTSVSVGCVPGAGSCSQTVQLRS